MKRILIISIAVLLVASSAQAAITTYFGEDLGGGENVRLTSTPNADAAATSFLSMLDGVGTESFESFSDGQTPGTLSFPIPEGTVTATFSGGMTVNTVSSGTNGVGRYPTDGDNYLEGSTSSFSITFSEAVAAFGFYGIDIGDFNGQVTVTTVNGGTHTYNVGNSTNIAGGSVLYWGIIDTENLFSSISFGNTASGTDHFGFDEMTVGTLEQVIPVPGAALLGVLGLSFAGAKLRRRKAA